MHTTCAHSCSTCGGKTCEDHDISQCLLWGEEECHNNPEAVIKLCPHMCRACTTVCKDTDKACSSWARNTTQHEEGECEKDTVMKLCPQSCGVCREAAKDDVKDEM